MTVNKNYVHMGIITDADLTGIHAAMEASGKFIAVTEKEYKELKFRQAEQRKWQAQGRLDDKFTMAYRKANIKEEIIADNERKNRMSVMAADSKNWRAISAAGSAQERQENNERINNIRMEKTAIKEKQIVLKDQEIQINRNREAISQQSKAATDNLGANLGMLFGVMGVTKAITTSTSTLVKWGLISEKNAEKLQKFNDVLNVTSTITTAYISIGMMKQAWEAKKSKQELNNMAIQTAKIKIEQQELSLKQQQLSVNATLIGLEGKVKAAKIKSAAATGINVAAVKAEKSAKDAATVSTIGYKTVASGGIMGPILIGALVAAIAGGLAAVSMNRASKAQFGMNDIVTSPRTVLVGENGAERVNVSPMGSSGSGGGGQPIINIYGYNNKDTIRRDVARALDDVFRGRA
jgi:hypothetical protein